MKIKIYFLVITMLIVTNSFGQDPIFTQSLLVPETINPAFTGYLNTYHAGLLHRRQWPNGNRRIDTDFAFLNKDITDHAGLGFTILKHKEEFTNYTYLQFNIAYSYVIEFYNDWFLRLGLESGYGTKNFNFGNLLLEDQININDGSITNQSNDPFLDNAKENINFVDFSTGFLIMKKDLKIGATLKHLTRPNISFINKDNIPLDLFLSIHGKYAIDLDEIGNTLFPEETKIIFLGNYMRQAKYNRLDLGTGLAFTTFTFGSNVSINLEKTTKNSHFLTSLNPFVSVKFDHFIFRYSYDANISKIGNTQGIHELSLTWRLNLESKCKICSTYIVEE